MVAPIILDFETEAIGPRPKYPPKPVGVALHTPGKKPTYMAWGHPEGNNCTEAEAKTKVGALWGGKAPIVMHNGKFDMDVAETHWGLPQLRHDQWEDTMLLAFLDSPHDRSLELKKLAPKLTGQQPAERDDLKAWVMEHIPEAKDSDWGAYISKAPAGIVGKYAAAGDAAMTRGVYDVLRKRIKDAGMDLAYDREKKVIPVLLDMERGGIRVPTERLRADVPQYLEAVERLDDWVRKYLKAPGLNIASSEQLADALEASGRGGSFLVTPTGKRSVSKKSLAQAVEDPVLILALDYRGTLANYLHNFMQPWLAQAEQTGGWTYTQWYSTKQEKEGGARTGRISCSPNLMNIPNDERRQELLAKLAPLFKKLKWLPPLPQPRGYILADTPDDVLIDRDYSQQEPRTLAHFEDGQLLEAYQKDPRMDIYNFVVGQVLVYAGIDLVANRGAKGARKAMKTIVLAIMYGLGLGELAKRLECTVDEAKALKGAFMKAVPGIKDLTDGLKQRAKANLPMTTWGGRRYYVEPPKVVKGVLRDFAYKLVNYLCQGSAADITKEAMIRYHGQRQLGRLKLSVHDQLTANVTKSRWQGEMIILRECMESVELDAPLVTDGSWGQCWGALEDCE